MLSTISTWRGRAFAAGALALVLAAASFAVSPAEAAKKPGSSEVTDAASADPSAAGPVVAAYQAQIPLACSNHGCDGHFAPLTAKQILRLHKVTCFISLPSSQTVYAAYLVAVPGTPFYFDLAQRSSTYTGNNITNVLFDEDGTFLVPKSETLHAEMNYSGNGAPDAYCSIYGEKVTYP